jgi:hypothetical protein
MSVVSTTTGSRQTVWICDGSRSTAAFIGRMSAAESFTLALSSMVQIGPNLLVNLPATRSAGFA